MKNIRKNYIMNENWLDLRAQNTILIKYYKSFYANNWAKI